MKSMIRVALMTAAVSLLCGQVWAGDLIKVPCRDMGDGRTLVDGQYLPGDWARDEIHYKIVSTRPSDVKDEWANEVCTLRIHRKGK